MEVEPLAMSDHVLVIQNDGFKVEVKAHMPDLHWANLSRDVMRECLTPPPPLSLPPLTTEEAEQLREEFTRRR